MSNDPLNENLKTKKQRILTQAKTSSNIQP
nr:MAG TPA: hypothetical protein [Caudoviricetes sp.]